MPRLTTLRNLDLERATGRGRPLHIAAASGLVSVGDRLYVVADDELHLGVFDRTGRRPGELVRIRAGTLPRRKRARKRAKPDFEALVALPPFGPFAFGALLVIGSGSRQTRRIGALVRLDASGDVVPPARAVGLDAWHRALADRFDVVNIEGAFVDGPTLSLLQRGNMSDPRNARIRITLAPILDALARRRRIPCPSIERIASFRLGAIRGTPLCFTDGAALPGGGFAFSAVAEATDDSVADGACKGSALGIVDGFDRLRGLWRLSPPLKVEGVVAHVDGTRVRLLACTDADDADVPARLLGVQLDYRRM
ncbi:MAG: hypothetical protein ABI585_09500 [Betaproteobacteria bacterium]